MCKGVKNSMESNKIIIKSLEDLIEVFPSLTENQIVLLFRKCVYELERINRLLGLCRNDEVMDALLERSETCCCIRDFLSGYLARCFCKLSGVDLF